MLELSHVCRKFGQRIAVDDINIGIPQGATHALIGSSGSGKTTLLKIILGILSPDQGEVKINDRKQTDVSQADWASGIGYVPQDSGLFPHLNGWDNAALIAKTRGWTHVKIKERIQDLTRLVDLDPEILFRYPSEMSGGQRQRIAIIRASVLDPALLLLDEPLGALDPLVRSSLQKELKNIFQKMAKTVMLVTHDLGEAVFLADQMTLLHQGQLIQTGTYQDFFYRPQTQFVTSFINAQRTLPELPEKN